MKQCKKCKKIKNEEDFYHHSNNKDNLFSTCKDCHRLKMNKRNKILTPEIKRKERIMRKYKITLNDYNKMFKEQKGICAICGKSESHINNKNKKIQNLSVDHDHKTGKVRALLCRQCNLGIGNFKEDIDIMKKGIFYLLKQKFS